MATQPTTSMPSEVQQVLSRLRGRVRRYILMYGTSSVLVLLSALFWASLAIDYGLSVSFQWEVGRLARFVILLAACSSALLGTLTWLLARLIRPCRPKSLALVLERRFPELNDRLITSVEMAGRHAETTPLTQSMLSRAMGEVSELTDQLELRRVFDMRPLRRRGLAALLLAVSVVGFGVAFPEMFGIWYRRNLLLADEYWPRETELRLVVLAEPNERVMEFQDGVYKHARGADLTLLATVPEGKVSPQQAQLSYRYSVRRGGGKAYFSKLGTSRFQYTLKAFQDSAELQISGGDYYSRRGYTVQVVDPPEVDQLVLDCRYPEYTGKNEYDSAGRLVRDEITVQGTQAALPVGTDFVLRGTTNKRLLNCRVETADFVLDFDGTSAKLTVRSKSGEPDRQLSLPPSAAQGLLREDRRGIDVPFVLDGTEEVSMLDSDGRIQLPLRLPVDCAMRIQLTDQDNVYGLRPANLSVTGLIDQFPVVATRPRGIGNAITVKAEIPVEGTITDDYGVVTARFDYKLNNDKKFTPKEFAARTGAGGEQEGDAVEPEREMEVAQRLKVADLDLAQGQKLTLTVFAEDGDTLNGPHGKRSEAAVFQIVDERELLSLIATRELNIRRRFEQILREVQETRKLLDTSRTRLQEANRLRSSKPTADEQPQVQQELAAIANTVISSSQQSLLGIRKNANESRAIEQEFLDIHAELENNKVDKAELDRVESILSPLNLLNTIQYNNVDEALGLFKLAVDENQDSLSRLDVCLQETDSTIAAMERVLAAMLKLETFNEAMELLKGIIAEQEKIQERVKSERKKILIEGLK